MAHEISTEIVDDFTRLEALAGDWESLWKSGPVREVFTKFGWTKASWRAFGSKRTLCTPVVYRGRKIIGILPVAAEKKCLRFIGAPRSDYNDVLCKESEATEVLEAALSSLLKIENSWDLCMFENLPLNSNFVKYYQCLEINAHSRLQLWFSDFCPTVELPPSEKESILKSILNKKSLKRHTNKLRKAGKLQFRNIEDRDEIAKHLPEFFRQHINRRSKAGGKSLFCSENSRNFYNALVEEFDPRQELRFSVLELDTRPIAYHFGFEVNGKFTWYKPAFDIELWDYSPGEVLLRNLFEYILVRKVNEFDFTVGNERFKSRFANHVDQNFMACFFPPGIRGRMRRHAIVTKEKIKKYPETYGKVKKFLMKIKSY